MAYEHLALGRRAILPSREVCLQRQQTLHLSLGGQQKVLCKSHRQVKPVIGQQRVEMRRTDVQRLPQLQYCQIADLEGFRIAEILA